MEELSPGVKVTVFLRWNEHGLMEKGKEVKANKKGVVWRPLQSSSLHGGSWEEGENHD